MIPGTLARRTTAAGWVSLWDVQEGLMGWVTPDGVAGAVVYQPDGAITATLSDGSTEQYGAAAGQTGGAAHLLLSRTLPANGTAAGFTETWTPPAEGQTAWTVTTVWTSGVIRVESATRGLTLADQDGSDATPPTRTITGWTIPTNTLSAVPDGLTISGTDPAAPVQATLSDGRILAVAADGTISIHPAPAQSGDPLPAAVETLGPDGTHAFIGTAATTRTLADGTVVIAAITITHPDGSLETQDAAGRQTSLTTSNGAISVTWPDGSIRTTTASGTITGIVTADGTAAVQQSNGTWQATLSDGTVIAWTPAGVLNAHAEPVPLPDATTGTRVTVYLVETDGPLIGLLAGAQVVTDPDGTETWTRSDGTLWKTWSADGTTLTLYNTSGQHTTTQMYNAEDANNAAGTILLRTETYAITGRVAGQRTHTVLNQDQAAQAATATTGPIPALAAGTVLIDQADGSQRAVDGSGQVLVVISASGQVAVWQGDGTWTVTAPDSTQTTVTPESGTGQWAITEADATVTTFTSAGTLASAALADGSSIVYTDAASIATTVMATTDANGVLTTQAMDGTVTVQYPTGSQADNETGLYIAQTVTAPDGTVTETFEANQVITSRVTKPDGSVTLTVSDGTTVATNGRTITTTLATGVIYTRDGYGRVFQQTDASAAQVQLSAQGVVVQTLENSVVLTWQAGGRFILDLGTGRTVEDAPNGEQVLTYANGDRLTAGITGFTLTEHADGTWTRSWPTGMTSAAFPAASDGTPNPAASVATTVALDGTGALVVTVPDGSTITTADAFTETPGTPVVSLASGSAAVEQTDHALVITTIADLQGRFTVATWAADGSVTVATQQYPSNEDGSVNLNGTPSFVEQWVYGAAGTATLTTPGASLAGLDNTTIATTVTQVTATDGTVTMTEPDSTLDSTNQPTYHTTVQSVEGMTVITQADGSSQTSFLDGSSQTQAVDGTLRHWAADQKTLTTTLTDGSTIERAADGTLTVTLPTGGSSLLTQNTDSSWTATLSGLQWTWANDGSGTITTMATDNTRTEARLDGTTMTTKSDGILITASSNGRTVQANPDGTVITQGASGARWQEDVAQGMVTLVSAQGETWQILPDPQVTKWAQDGTVTQTTDRAGSSTTWGTDGSTTSVANGLTTTTAADKTRTLTTATGDSVTIAPTGSVTASGFTANNDGSYDVGGGGTNVASNGVITVTLEDGSTLTEQTNGVVSLHALDGTETTWTPPGVSSAYPNGWVSRTHPPDGLVEGWYTADDKNLDTLYVRLVAPKAPTNAHVYGSGLRMEIETTGGTALTVQTPNGAVLVQAKDGAGMVSAAVSKRKQAYTETRIDHQDNIQGRGYLPGTVSPRSPGDATDVDTLWIGLFPRYRLSDPGGAALAQLAASGRKFAIGASLDDPASLWVGDTVDEQQVMVTRSVTLIHDWIEQKLVQAGYWYRWTTWCQHSDGTGHSVQNAKWIPPVYQPVEHHDPTTTVSPAYQDGWDYIIDGVTHHSKTPLQVWAITPPAAESAYLAEWEVYRVGHEESNGAPAHSFSDAVDKGGRHQRAIASPDDVTMLGQTEDGHWRFRLKDDPTVYLSSMYPRAVLQKPPAFPTAVPTLQDAIGAMGMAKTVAGLAPSQPAPAGVTSLPAGGGPTAPPSAITAAQATKALKSLWQPFYNAVKHLGGAVVQWWKDLTNFNTFKQMLQAVLSEGDDSFLDLERGSGVIPTIGEHCQTFEENISQVLRSNNFSPLAFGRLISIGEYKGIASYTNTSAYGPIALGWASANAGARLGQFAGAPGMIIGALTLGAIGTVAGAVWSNDKEEDHDVSFVYFHGQRYFIDPWLYSFNECGGWPPTNFYNSRYFLMPEGEYRQALEQLYEKVGYQPTGISLAYQEDKNPHTDRMNTPWTASP